VKLHLRFELFEYRHILVRMRRGDSDRDIARRRLMGRAKLAAVRQEAQTRGWLDPAQPMPEDAEIASVFDSIPRQVASSCISTAEPYREQVREWFTAGVQGTTIHAALQRNHGYAGSYEAVKRMLRRLAAERAEDRRALYTGIEPAADQIAKRLERGDAATWHLRVASEDARQLGVVWQGPPPIEPAVGKRDLPYGLQLAAPHQVRAGNVAVGIALAHAHQNLSIFKHFNRTYAKSRA